MFKGKINRDYIEVMLKVIVSIFITILIILILYFDIIRDQTMGFRSFIVISFLAFCLFLVFILNLVTTSNLLLENKFTRFFILFLFVLIVGIFYSEIIYDFIIFLLFFPIKFLGSNFILSILSSIFGINTTFVFWNSMIIGYPLTLIYWIVICKQLVNVIQQNIKLNISKDVFEQSFLKVKSSLQKQIAICVIIFMISVFSKLFIIIFSNGAIVGYDVTNYMRISLMEISELDLFNRFPLFCSIIILQGIGILSSEILIPILLVFFSSLVPVEIYLICQKLNFSKRNSLFSSFSLIFSANQYIASLSLLSQYFSISLVLLSLLIIFRIKKDFSSLPKAILVFITFLIAILSHELSLFFILIFMISLAFILILNKINSNLVQKNLVRIDNEIEEKYGTFLRNIKNYLRINRTWILLFFTITILIILGEWVVMVLTDPWGYTEDFLGSIMVYLSFYAYWMEKTALDKTNLYTPGYGHDLSNVTKFFPPHLDNLLTSFFTFSLVWVLIIFGFIGLIIYIYREEDEYSKTIIISAIGVSVLFSTGLLHTWMMSFRMILYLEIFLSPFMGIGVENCIRIIKNYNLSSVNTRNLIKPFIVILLILSTGYSAITSINNPAVPSELISSADWVTNTYFDFGNATITVHVSNITNPTSFTHYLSYKWMFGNYNGQVIYKSLQSSLLNSSSFDFIFFYKSYDILKLPDHFLSDFSLVYDRNNVQVFTSLNAD